MHQILLQTGGECSGNFENVTRVAFGEQTMEITQISEWFIQVTKWKVL
jgi:hypothetical protein